jgi:hypothetical protein
LDDVFCFVEEYFRDLKVLIRVVEDLLHLLMLLHLLLTLNQHLP